MKTQPQATSGIFTALVTPFDSKGAIDWEAYRRILRDQREAGVAGVIPSGTTGESPTLLLEEKKKLIEFTITELKGSGIRVFAGTGSNSTPDTVELSRWASQAGVDGVLIVAPYYNKPSQAGLEKHFLAVADAVDCEVMLYNVPGRTGVAISAETVAKLAAHPRIRSIKEATGNPNVTSDIRDALALAGRSMAILSGDDGTWLPLMTLGATGVVSVASNLFPRGMAAIQDAFNAGDMKRARDLQDRYYPLFRDLFVEANPVPIKLCMAEMGFCEATVRPPLAPLTQKSREVLLTALRRCGIEKGRPA